MPSDSRIVTGYDQFLAATIESYPGHSAAWYEARVAEAVWFILHDGDMSDCPARMPQDQSLVYVDSIAHI